MKIIDEIKITYTPKKDIDFETLMCYYPIIYGKGSCMSASCYLSDDVKKKQQYNLFKGLEYTIVCNIISFAEHYNPVSIL